MYKCTYIFQKGIKKGKICGKINCQLHKNKQEQKQESKTIPINLQKPQSVDVNTEKYNNEIEKIVKRKLTQEESIKQQILELSTSIDNKTTIMKMLLNIKKLDINTTEYYKNKLYIDQALLIPWNKYYNIRSNIGIIEDYITLDEHIHNKILIKNFIEKVKQELDKDIYGMENIKNEIINYVCKFITNPTSHKNILALYGAAGVCKTKFIKILSKVLNLPIKIISLGGMRDSSYLLGHSQTYQDSKCGIIIQSIIESKIMNPILYFDELDKISNGEYGQDIHSVLCNLTDSTINSNFKDRYFSNLSIDLSKVFYIFTFNDISKINKVLLDRLNIIYVENPSKQEKIIILKNYCMSEIQENIGIRLNIQFTDDCYRMVIDYTDKYVNLNVSSGIRESVRILEKIMLEINKEILLTIEINVNDIIIDKSKFSIYFNKLKNQFMKITYDDPPEFMYV
jgi:ATP-dependent Lon protease